MLITDEFIRDMEKTESLREYIWLCETGMPYSRPEPSLETPFFLGKQDGTGYYLFFQPDKESVLDLDTLSVIKSKCELYVIHAHHCLLSTSYLKQCNIVFKKIPKELVWKDANVNTLSKQRLEIFKSDSMKGELK